MKKHVAIIGAGPAGLTAAYLLCKENIAVTVLEANPSYVGGISRTVVYKGFCADIGGHRFFSKSDEVEALWTELLPNDMLDRPRSSRIYYNKQFFAYPLKAFEALFKLGIIQSTLCVASYCKTKIFPIPNPTSFADWVTNHFGKRLFNIFFKTYTEKVWGMSCNDISADWAAQRIKGLSLSSAILNAIIPKRQSKSVIKTLIDTFRYPRKGPGMLWESCAKKIANKGGEIRLGSSVNRIKYDSNTKLWTVGFLSSDGQAQELSATHLISSAPMRDLVANYFSTPIPTPITEAATALKYRDFLIVVLILKDKNLFSDNWIYIHDPTVDVARIQNFKSWSPEMVPDPAMCSYGLEYFCFENDKIWNASDADLIKKASKEVAALGLAKEEEILDGHVIRQAQAYPVYDHHYQQHVEKIRNYLESEFPSLHLVGRNGMHKYNNQDHAMMTAMLTVKNILSDKRDYDTWCVNQDAEYIESVSDQDLKKELGIRQTPLPKNQPSS